MKYRDSGMPPQEYWETLLDADAVIERFLLGPETGEVAELGSGYGTFTIPLARRTGSVVHAFDIDPLMIEATHRRAEDGGLRNVRPSLRDVFAEGFGLSDDICGACLLFNILHGESPIPMLREAARVLRPGGTIAVIHWRSDITTPRGPDLDIRPRPEQIVSWASQVDGIELHQAPFLLPPWHFGVTFKKRPRREPTTEPR